MSELSFMGKLMKAMELSKAAHTGLTLTYFDVIELSGEIEALKGYIAELEAELKNARELIGMTPEPAFPAWIPVSERLPEENQQILSTDGKEFYLDYYARWEGKDNPPCFCDGLSWAVTHWMPLPGMPEAEE